MENLLSGLQAAVRVQDTFVLADYFSICHSFLNFIASNRTTRIVSPFPQNRHYIFFQYGEESSYRITRPLNTQLFIESPTQFQAAFERFMAFLSDLRLHQEASSTRSSNISYIESKEVNQVVY